jgi:outer membrane protein OmpA-like peptidoglycan-associated protein
MLNKSVSYGFLVVALSASAFAQEANPTSNAQRPPDQSSTMTAAGMRDNVPLYRIQVVGRDIPAINYFHRSGSTKIGFEGTSLLPRAKGVAKVNSQEGRTMIDAEFEGLAPANSFGIEYLTYVLWAITPEGRPTNLGEVLPTGSKDKNHITVTSNLQAFGLVITAEPYYAVTMPSDVVVMQNVVLEDKTEGVLEQVNAHYSLLPRGAYEQVAGRPAKLHAISRNDESPLEVLEAENAVQIADAAGAEKYAPDTMVTANTALKNAEDLDSNKHVDRKQTITYAREAVQSAEDARIITIRKIKAEDDLATQQARLDAEAAARKSDADAQQSKMNAQQSQLDAEKAKQDADKAQLEAQQQAAQRAQADADRAKAEAAAAEADANARKARDAQQAAELSAQQATQQVAQARERLKQQLNQVLQTTETARGLIVNMPDVLFDFNKYTLKPEAREKLAKVSGILLAYPDLKTQVEGYTDSIGSEEYNQKLSEERAGTVRSYLVTQSVQEANVTAMGFGKTKPIADNSTSKGRAQNRRVELVVSGAAIGIGGTTPSAQIPVQPVPVTQIEPPAAPAQTAPPADQSGVSNPPR